MTKDFIRLCPTCGAKKFYHNANRLQIAVKNNKPCKSCTMKKVHTKNPDRCHGKNNPMYGTDAVTLWHDRFSGEELATKISKLRALQSERMSGENNPMYGRPSPEKCGRGISGRWYDLPFRSLLELAFLEDFQIKHGTLPRSAERKEYKLTLSSGKNYFPDFVDPLSGIIYEIKPRKLLNHNAEKIRAGIEAHGSKYQIITEDDVAYRGINTRLHLFNELVLNRRKSKS